MLFRMDDGSVTSGKVSYAIVDTEDFGIGDNGDKHTESVGLLFQDEVPSVVWSWKYQKLLPSWTIVATTEPVFGKSICVL